MQRIIFHIDLNGFYASVEEALHPELRAVPMAICGDPDSRRGIILAKNELAKGFGVKTAETIWQARMKCPQLVLAPARHGLYGQYSERVNEIYCQYTDILERAGIDESYLDVTGSLHLFSGGAQDFAAAEELAHAIRERVKAELDLTVSAGVSFNKAFAKIGSDYKKPDAVTCITPENFRDIVWPLPVNALMMVGRVTDNILRELGLRTIGELAGADEAVLSLRLGKAAGMLWRTAHGLDDAPVIPEPEREGIHSVGNSITFPRNLLSWEDVQTAAAALCDKVAGRMRRAGVLGRTVSVSIKDPRLRVISRQCVLSAPTQLASELYDAVMGLMRAAWSPGQPIRMLGVTAMRLTDGGEPDDQLSLFDEAQSGESREKRIRLEETIDSIRDRYGKDSIKPGRVLGSDLVDS